MRAQLLLVVNARVGPVRLLKRQHDAFCDRGEGLVEPIPVKPRPQNRMPLDIGTEFVFALVVPQLTEPLRLKGKVQWVTKVEDATDEKPAGMGIRFLYEDPDERKRVEDAVEQLMTTELGEHLSARLLGKGQSA